MSELFPRGKKPVLLLIDQIDNFMMDAKGLRRMQTLVKTLAEDSVLNQNFVVLAVCSSPHLATALLDANGRQKIVLVTPSVSQFKWSRSMLQELLLRVKCTDGVGGSTREMREQLITAATLAGSPGFLLHHLDNLTDAGSLQVLFVSN